MTNMTQAESEAIIRLLLAGRVRDGKVSLPEGDEFEKQIATLPWTAEQDRHFFVVTEAARIRKTMATHGADFLTEQTTALRSTPARATALAMLHKVLAADGLDPQESAFVAYVQKALSN